MKTAALAFDNPIRPKRLLDSVAIIVMLLVVVLLASIGGIFSQMTVDLVDKQTHRRAVQTARQLALLPEMHRYVRDPDAEADLIALSESLRRQTDMEYVLVADARGRVLTGPDPALVGGTITDPLAVRALQFGGEYSQRTTAGDRRYILGAAPIIDSAHAIIGMVSVGYPIEPIRKASDASLERIVFFTLVFITLGLVAANFIAKGVKWVIFGLEPAEIAYMFQERTALIESIREGIISTDADGTISLVNEAALTTLRLREKSDLQGHCLQDFFPALDTARILATGEPVLDREFVLAGVPIIVNAEPVGPGRGLVVTFRKKEDIDMIARELSQVQTFSDMLRAQTHEYSNSLHTIVGMIQIGAYDEVLSFIADETRGHRKLIRFLAENLPDRILSSMIIGKYMFAGEQKVEFVIDPESRMIDLPDALDRHTLTTALGNIIDNAIEAAGAGSRPARVTLFMSDYGHDLLFEVEDSGNGIPEDILPHIFARGFSTKESGKHGYGLSLARKAVETLGGVIGVSADGATRFEIILPKGTTVHATP